MSDVLARFKSVGRSDSGVLRLSQWGAESAENSALQYGHFAALSWIVLAQLGQSRAPVLVSSIIAINPLGFERSIVF